MTEKQTVKTKHRATPADPTVGITHETPLPRAESRNIPPELGEDAIAILEGRTFMYSNDVGDVPDGTIGGLIHADTRFINTWVLTINGERLLPLRSGSVNYYSAAFFLTNPRMPNIRADRLAVRRLRFVGGGFHEKIEITNFDKKELSFEVRLAVGNDFADLFEVKSKTRYKPKDITVDQAEDGSQLRFEYKNKTFSADTTVKVSPKATRIENNAFVWEITLTPEEKWECEIEVPVQLGPNEIQPRHKTFDEAFSLKGDDAVKKWLAQRPRVESDSYLLNQVIRKSAHDLASLRLNMEIEQQEVLLPAAGLPWFLTLFGRDTLITAYQSMSSGPLLAKGALLLLAAGQGKEENDFKDEEPGKILHESRSGELTQLGIKPHNPYYGTADATQLWLILLSEYWRWTKDDEFVKRLKENVISALSWIDNYGDRDGDGYVEYQTRSSQGLGNQCWRDSWEGVQFADASIPYLPIATCELQGYVYDAKLRVAELMDGPLEDQEGAKRLRKEAEDLKNRFNKDFWINKRGGYYALGLDGDKRKIDSLTSNIGHLLWSGIVPEERAAIIAKHLLSDALFSGWGVRTLSTEDRGYNPIGYHLGTVWPHDNSLIAAGLALYGFRKEANKIILSLLDAASFSDYRLPEAFSGYNRDVGHFPIPYPTACSPQAWASGAPLLFVRSMLGLEIKDSHLTVNPDVPPEIGRILITKTYAFGKKWDIEANGKNGDVRLSAL